MEFWKKVYLYYGMNVIAFYFRENDDTFYDEYVFHERPRDSPFYGVGTMQRAGYITNGCFTEKFIKEVMYE